MSDLNLQTKSRSRLWLWFLLSAIVIALVIMYTKNKSYDENGGPEIENGSTGTNSGRGGGNQ